MAKKTKKTKLIANGPLGVARDPAIRKVYHVNDQEAAQSGQVTEYVNGMGMAPPAPQEGCIWGANVSTPAYKERMQNIADATSALRETFAKAHNVGNSKLAIADTMKSFEQTMDVEAYKTIVNGIQAEAATNVANGINEFYARQLTEFYPLTLFTKYPDLQYSEYTSIYSGKPYSTQMATQMFDYTGLGDTDFDDGTRATESTDPIVVGAKVSEQLDPIYTTHLAVDFELTEQWALQQAPRYGIGAGGTSPIVQVKFMSLARQQEVILNKRCLGIGTPSVYGIKGIFNDPTVPKEVLGAIPGTTAPVWASKTPDEILNDIIVSFNYLNTQSRGVHTANTLVMSNAAYNIFRGLPRSAFSELSVDQWVVRNMPSIDRIIPDTYLDGIGVAGSNVMFFTEKSPENHYMSVNAKSYGMRPDYYNGNKLRMPFMLRSSGFILLRSLSCLIVEGL